MALARHENASNTMKQRVLKRKDMRVPDADRISDIHCENPHVESSFYP